MSRVIIYARVSTDAQAEHGVSLEAQVARCQAYAELHEFEVVATITDARSGKSLDRPGWREVAALLHGGQADGVVIAKLDRLTRSLRDLDTLLTTYFAGDIALHCIAERVDTSTAAGRLCLNMLMSVSQWEREVIGERTSAALAHKASRGERVGQIPFGSRLAADGIHLVQDMGEQRVIDRILELRSEGISLRRIVARFNASETPSRGERWHLSTVARLARRHAARPH